MEMLEGETLAELLTACAPLPFEQTVKIVSQIAQGLGSLHRAGITHRDLKPSNVFLQRGVGAKILDFGIARTEGSDETATATFMGTRRYASPEQAEDSSSAEPRSDLFSLGLITYECLLGASPYEGSSAGQIAELREKLPTPSTRGTVPPGFDDWFHRATHPDVDQRFEDAEQLTRALRQAFAENPGSRPPGKLAMAQVGDADTESVNDAPLVSESAPGSSSRRLRGGLVVAAIIALGLVFFIVFDGQTPPSRSQSTQTSRATDARATDARASDAQAADGVGSDAHSLGPPAARNLSKEESSAVVLAGPSDDTAVASKSLPLEKKSRSAAQSPSAAKKALNRPPQSAPEPDFSAKRTSGTEDASSQSDPFELRK
jgi:serine/threonine protein kinase